MTSVALEILGANGKKAVSAVGLTRGLHEVPFVNSLRHLAQDPSGLKNFIYEVKIIIISTQPG